jgi:acyl-CoA reductase-like NAD-dependent aldehyde dehydrogenase
MPVGVLGVFAPYNYPCHNFFNHIISEIFAGNANVIKVSEYTSWSSNFYLKKINSKRFKDRPPLI